MRSRNVGLIVLAAVVATPLVAMGVRMIGSHAPRERPAVVVVTTWPGAPPADVERHVTIPMELALASVRGIAAQSNTSTASVSSIRLELVGDADEMLVRQEVMERLRDAALPPGTFSALRAAGTSTLTFALVPEPQTDLATLRAIADWELESAMKQIPGVSDITTCGGRERRLEVRLDPQRLRAVGVQATDVVNELVMRAMIGTGGSPRGAGGFRGTGSLTKMPLPNAAIARLADVAVIADGQKAPDCIASDGKSELAISELTLRPGADVAKVALDVNAKLRELTGYFPVRIVPLEMEKRAPFVHVRTWLPRTESDALVATIRAIPEVADVYARKTDDETELLVRAAANTDATKLARAIARTLEAQPGIAFDLTSPQVELPRELRAVRLRVTGPDLERLREVAQHVTNALHDTPGLGSAAVPDARLLPHLNVTPDRNALARFGVSSDTVIQAMAIGSEGQIVGQYLEGARRFDVVVLTPKSTGNDGDDLTNLTVSTPDGAQVPLSTLATIVLDATPWRISRSGGARFVDLFFHARDGGAFEAARTALTKVQLPPDVSIAISHEGD